MDGAIASLAGCAATIVGLKAAASGLNEVLRCPNLGSRCSILVFSLGLGRLRKSNLSLGDVRSTRASCDHARGECGSDLVSLLHAKPSNERDGAGQTRFNAFLAVK
jgi:hypothetical protein